MGVVLSSEEVHHTGERLSVVVELHTGPLAEQTTVECGRLDPVDIAGPVETHAGIEAELASLVRVAADLVIQIPKEIRIGDKASRARLAGFLHSISLLALFEDATSTCFVEAESNAFRRCIGTHVAQARTGRRREVHDGRKPAILDALLRLRVGRSEERGHAFYYTHSPGVARANIVFSESS